VGQEGPKEEVFAIGDDDSEEEVAEPVTERVDRAAEEAEEAARRA
jgi:hypothetical protein